MKIAIGIEKYLLMKNDLANALKEKKALEKEITKQEEKYDHKIAKLKDKNYKLKDKLEDKESEAEKLESKLKKLKEKYDYESDDNDEDDEDESEEDSDEDSSVNINEYVREHQVDAIHEYLRDFLPDTTTTDTDTPDEKFDDEEATLKNIDSDDDDSRTGSSRSDELEEVIEDMTEERTVLQSKIEELERKLREKDDEKLGLIKKKITIEKSTSETTETDDDNVSVTTDDSFLLDADKLNLVSGQESEYSWITKTPSSETVERSSSSEHDEINQRDVNNNIVIDGTGDVPEYNETSNVEKTTVPEPSAEPDGKKTSDSDPVENPDDRETTEQAVAAEGGTVGDVHKEMSNADQTVEV